MRPAVISEHMAVGHDSCASLDWSLRAGLTKNVARTPAPAAHRALVASPPLDRRRRSARRFVPLDRHRRAAGAVRTTSVAGLGHVDLASTGRLDVGFDAGCVARALGWSGVGIVTVCAPGVLGSPRTASTTASVNHDGEHSYQCQQQTHPISSDAKLSVAGRRTACSLVRSGSSVAATSSSCPRRSA